MSRDPALIGGVSGPTVLSRGGKLTEVVAWRGSFLSNFQRVKFCWVWISIGIALEHARVQVSNIGIATKLRNSTWDAEIPVLLRSESAETDIFAADSLSPCILWIWVKCWWYLFHFSMRSLSFQICLSPHSHSQIVNVTRHFFSTDPQLNSFIPVIFVPDDCSAWYKQSIAWKCVREESTHLKKEFLLKSFYPLNMDIPGSWAMSQISSFQGNLH